MKAKMDTERAKALGRSLFQKYDLGKRGALGPKQCYEVFSDFCYRILSINQPPTMQEASTMFEVLDDNKDKRVTQADFENLAVKYLCQGTSFTQQSPLSYIPSNTFQSSQVSQTSYHSTNISTAKNVGGYQFNPLQSSNVTKFVDPSPVQTITPTNLTTIARKRIDVARRLFKMFDKDGNGTLTQDEIPFIIQQTYREMKQDYQPSKEDVRSYMKMVDTDGDGKVSLNQFEEIILKSLKNAGYEIYE